MAENTGKAPKRRGPGRPFQKGVSGNPGGRPRDIAEIRELARSHAPAAIGTLVEIMTDREKSPAARVSAATEILSRGYGKPPQELTGANGEPLIPKTPTINLVLAESKHG
jgi:hypothetical protein